MGKDGLGKDESIASLDMPLQLLQAERANQVSRQASKHSKLLLVNSWVKRKR